MGDSKNITATKGRLLEDLNRLNQMTIESTVPNKIERAVNNEKIRTGVITKFYPYLDKAEVKLDYNGKKILCGILHRFGGDIIEFYTPLSFEADYDENLHEPYIIPRASQNVCVLNVYKDNENSETLILGYLNSFSDMEGFNPANDGNIKIMSLCEDGNEYWIKFGKDGFNYRVPKKPTKYVGDIHTDGVNEVDYAKSDEVYNKNEIDELLNGTSNNFYTKEALDEKFSAYEQRISELEGLIQQENIDDEENDDGG